MSPRFDLNYSGDFSAWRVHNGVDYLQIDASSIFKHQIDAFEGGLDYSQTLFYLKGSFSLKSSWCDWLFAFSFLIKTSNGCISMCRLALSRLTS